jgi:signal transduction histidine kinase
VTIGNARGDVWTDVMKPVPPPPLDAARNGQSEYQGADRAWRLGVLADVRGTPWCVWVEARRDDVVAPARAFLRRMLLVAGVLLALSAVLIWTATSSITVPLEQLTSASEAMAAGDYSTPVRPMRRDEIGRLGAAFETMRMRVAHAHRDLEERLQRRTATLEETTQLLAQLNHEHASLSHSVSHELRAPLRHISGSAMLLQQSSDRLSDDDRGTLGIITETAARMGRLIDDLLALSRAGRPPLTRAPVD